MSDLLEGEVILYEDDYYMFTQCGPMNTEDLPVLVLPPFAGRGGSVTDNLVKKCVAAGRTTYRYELKSATKKTKDLSVSGLVDIVYDCVQMILIAHRVSSLDLLGTCQGGWLASIYASLFPYRVNRLALFAAPINTKTGCGNAIETYCSTIDLEKHKRIVKAAGGVQPGALQWMSFALLAPEFVFYERYADLMGKTMAGDIKGVKSWWKINKWYDSTRDLAGVWFLDALESHFTKNGLYEGTWVVYGSPVDLGNIVCPVYVMAGLDDIITSTEQTMGILDKVSSSVKVYVPLEGAGHTKCFAGKKELAVFSKKFFGV